MRRWAVGALLVACSCGERGPANGADSERARSGTPAAVESYVVNHGSRGMAARVRWALSPDSTAILAMEDPAAIEADPVPNGFVLAREQGPVLQRDSVWDVATSPDWTRLAYARAYTTQPGERDSLTAAEWSELAARVGLPVDVVRANAFSTSGMTYAYGTGRPVVVDSTERPLPIAGAWRVAWTGDGKLLAIGAPGQRTQDDAPAERWTTVDPSTGARMGATTPDKLVPVQWIDGPTLDISITVDSTPRTVLRRGAVEVRSAMGLVRRVEEATDGTTRSVVIGRGVALAATRDGRVILALAPKPAAAEFEHPLQLVVYRVPR